MAWTLQNDNPALACPAPLLSRAGFGHSQVDALLRQTSPDIPSVLAEIALSVSATLPSTRASAFSVVAPTVSSSATNLSVLHPGLSVMPAILDRMGANNILRQTITAPYKPIPNNDRVDLVRFRVKEPYDWRIDDTVSFLMDIAKRYNIPFEEMNMHRMSTMTGQQLIFMSEKDFMERDPNFGSLIFKELKTMVSDDTLIDNIMRKYNSEEEERASTSSNALAFDPLATIAATISPLPQASFIPAVKQSLQQSSCAKQSQPENTFNIFQSPSRSTASVIGQAQASTSSQSQPTSRVIIDQRTADETTLAYPNHESNSAVAAVAAVLNQNSLLNRTAALAGIESSPSTVHSLQQTLVDQLGVAFGSGISSANMNLVSTSVCSTSPSISSCIQQRIPQISSSNEHVLYDYKNDPNQSESTGGGVIKRNKDGRPRKRSQHTKGNKLWEFIRDALKDPETCPSVVRWEDPIEGVFRIVESEKLARLWGERKNNKKMTYEKLSRAMRTYYEKQILVPVPKTGIYPKKLVYKFGPGAYSSKNKNVE